MSTIRTSNFGPLTGNTASVVDPSTPTNGIARVSPLVSFASVASTSGTSIDFTGIPSWARRVTLMFSGVSTNGSSNPLIQIGSGSITTSGYVSHGCVAGASNFAGGSNYTTGFGLISGASASVIHGHAMLTFLNANTWICSGITSVAASGVYYMMNFGGTSPSLSGALDRVRITTVNGTDTFDAGTISVMYE